MLLFGRHGEKRSATCAPIRLLGVALGFDLGDVPRDVADYLLRMPCSMWQPSYGLCVTVHLCCYHARCTYANYAIVMKLKSATTRTDSTIECHVLLRSWDTECTGTRPLPRHAKGDQPSPWRSATLSLEMIDSLFSIDQSTAQRHRLGASACVAFNGDRVGGSKRNLTLLSVGAAALSAANHDPEQRHDHVCMDYLH